MYLQLHLDIRLRNIGNGRFVTQKGAFSWKKDLRKKKNYTEILKSDREGSPDKETSKGTIQSEQMQRPFTDKFNKIPR